MSRIYNSVSSSTNKTATGSSAPTMSDKKALFSSSSTSNNTNTNSTTNISANIHHLQQHNNKPSPQPPSTSSVNKFTHHNIDQSHTTTSVNLTGEKNNRANTIEAAAASASNNVNTTNSSTKTTTDETATRIMAEESLTKLISRLETVTNRLESYAHHAGPSSHPIVNGTAAKPTQNGTAEPLPASIAGFDDIINGSLASFKELSGKIGTEVKTIVDIVEKVFKLERSFLIEAARSVQPSQDALNKFFQQFAKSIEEVQAFKEKNRSSALFNHLSTISESIGALGWIAVSPAPAPYVKEMSDSGQFFSNRVLKEYKEKDQNHVNWVKQWLQLLSELQAYVKQTHTTGVAWNSTRQSKTFDASRVSTSDSSSSSAPAPPAAAPSGPPPPPPPPMPSFNDLFAEGGNQQSGGGASTHEALFAEINKGSDITRTLKKVSDDQKTHKNPNLRAANTVPGAPSTTKTVKSGPGASATVKPPVLELQDKKWRVEYQRNNHNLVISDTDLKQTIYIYNCSECTVTVKGKVNSITIDSCHRVGLLFDDVLAMVEFINSTSSQMQVMGKCPTVSIDKSDAIQVYLSRASIDAEIVTSKSSAMNVLVPNENGDEFSEYPVPEQYKTLFNIKSKKLVTTPTETA